ncbi:NUDIX domain-containing protein [Candidatus Dojkabacteria bacterium]|nr:NUDIX domain-containing protein [Candidatus Dojkabacteria bacterium]
MNQKIETLIVVDKNDKIIDFQPRSICHNPSKLLLHREVHICLLNKKGEFLIQKRSTNKKTFPGMYTNSPTGHVEKGETYEEAALKEVKEELGIKDIELHFTKKFITNTPQNRAYISIFTGIHNGPFMISRKEVDEVKFYNKESIKSIANKLTPACKKCLRTLNLIN